jgi:hypothetical protein
MLKEMRLQQQILEGIRHAEQERAIHDAVWARAGSTW